MVTRNLTAAVFKQTIDVNDNVLVYFWAPLCRPCDLFTPTYESSSNKHFDIVHAKVNYETEKDLVELAKVQHLPTLMAFKKGTLVFRQAGVANPSVMDNLVRQLRTYKFKVESPPQAQRGLL
ncbi:Putative thioredoxin 2 [Mycobacterium simulans]|nr:thioredoxin family protein [Mycobacterium simulans]SON63196.1 Putative thioredoxin 2 [Mycobacterium simulans]